ncbi:MAG: Clp protease N-terminal domain-containing protein [Streptosporangiaceae bacterium]
MIAIDVADLVVIAGQVLGVGPDAALEQVDLAAARAALAAAKPPAAELTEADPAECGRAAVLLIRALLRHRPFPGQNERVAVAAALQFLAMNGWRADLDPPEATVEVIEGLAASLVTPADAAAWLSARLSLYSAPRAKEAPMRTLRVSRRLRVLNPKPQAGIQTPVTGFMPFTDDACDVVVRARAEADRLGLDRPGSEQLLLALAGTGQGVAAQALNRLGISPAAVRQKVTQVPGRPQPPVPPQADTPLARQVMPRAVGEAVAHGHDYIGTEHILLGLFHAGDDVAARALTSLGAGEHEVRAAILAVTGDPGPGRPAYHRRHKPGPRDDEIRRLRAEVARLGELLREHGIEPGDGGQRSA